MKGKKVKEKFKVSESNVTFHNAYKKKKKKRRKEKNKEIHVLYNSHSV